MPATDLGVTALSDERGGHHALWTSDSLTRKEDPRFLTGCLGWGPYRWQGVTPYLVWVPGSAVFDYPLSDMQPTNGWGNL